MISQRNAYNLIQTAFFAVISCTLMWALWIEIPSHDILYTIVCIAMFILNLAVFERKRLYPLMIRLLPVYSCIILWSIFMIIAFSSFHNVHSEIELFSYQIDAYAVFFIRMLFVIVASMFYIDFNTINDSKIFKLIVGLIIVTSVVYTIRAINMYPDALRARNIMEMRNEEEFLFGTPGYAIIYGISLLVPVFLQKCKNEKGKSRIFYAVCTVMIVYMIFVSQFATAVFLAIIGTLVFLFFNVKSKAKTIFLLLLLIFTLLIHLFNIDSMFFVFLSEKVDGSWSEKLQDMAESLSNGDFIGTLSSRVDLYTTSMKTFAESPLFGKLSKYTGDIGGHATAIDTLGLVGILGFIPFILMIYFQFRRMKCTCNYKKNKAAIISCVIEFILLVFLKNIITSYAIFFSFFVLAPLILKMEKRKKDSN